MEVLVKAEVLAEAWHRITGFGAIHILVLYVRGERASLYRAADNDVMVPNICAYSSKERTAPRKARETRSAEDDASRVMSDN